MSRKPTTSNITDGGQRKIVHYNDGTGNPLGGCENTTGRNWKADGGHVDCMGCINAKRRQQEAAGAVPVQRGRRGTIATPKRPRNGVTVGSGPVFQAPVFIDRPVPPAAAEKPAVIVEPTVEETPPMPNVTEQSDTAPAITARVTVQNPLVLDLGELIPDTTVTTKYIVTLMAPEGLNPNTGEKENERPLILRDIEAPDSKTALMIAYKRLMFGIVQETQHSWMGGGGE